MLERLQNNLRLPQLFLTQLTRAGQLAGGRIAFDDGLQLEVLACLEKLCLARLFLALRIATAACASVAAATGATVESRGAARRRQGRRHADERVDDHVAIGRHVHLVLFVRV